MPKMTQKRKPRQTKLVELERILEQIDRETTARTRKNLGPRWRDNLFEIVMTRLEIAHKNKSLHTYVAGYLFETPLDAHHLTKKFMRILHDILVLAKAPSGPLHMTFFGIFYIEVINLYLKEPESNCSKTMALLDQRITFLEKLPVC